jgi:WD40 repeat protein
MNQHIPVEPDSAPEFAHSYAVVVGIDQYTNGITALRNAVNDARALGASLAELHGYSVQTLFDQAATYAALTQYFTSTLPTKVGLDDRLLIYFSGHGVALEGDDGPAGYLIPQDASATDLASWLPMAALRDALARIPCRHLLLILDCCFAGAVRWSATRNMPIAPHKLYRERYQRYIRDQAWQVLTSAAADERALDVMARFDQRASAGDHSPFAQALLDALKGEADISARRGVSVGDGVITATELYIYLSERFGELVDAQQRQTPGLWYLPKHDKGEFVFKAPGAVVDLPPTPDNNPFRGLEPFDEQHAELFFGREAAIETLHMIVTASSKPEGVKGAGGTFSPLVVVAGASGVGKSSLVRAGLLPRLQNDATWRIVPPLRLGAAPRRALAAIQLPPSDPPTLAQRIGVELADHPATQLLLLIDQADELVALCSPEERALVLKELADAAAAHPERLRIVLTIRADFEAPLADSPLAEHWRRARRMVVPPMAQDDLRQAIVGPATAHALGFEPDTMVERIINDVLEMPGRLPLLSFTLSQLYLSLLERGDNSAALREADYDALGSVAGALRTHAEAEYCKLDADQQATIQRVLLRMVELEGGAVVRRRVPRAEFDSPDEKENKRVAEIIARLENARLLVSGQEADIAYVELAHDALVRGWARFQSWVRGAQASLILRPWLTLDSTLWEQNGRGLQWLRPNDPRLRQADAVRCAPDSWLNRSEAAFVEASIAVRNAEQQRELEAERQRAEEQARARAEAERLRLTSIAQALAVQAPRIQERWKQDELGALLARQAYLFNQRSQGVALDQVDEALRAVLGTAFFSVTLHGHTDRGRTVAWSPDGRILASGGLDGAVRLWDVARPGQAPPTLQCHELWVTCLAFSPSGQLLATASDDQTVRLWNLSDLKQAPVVLQHDRRVWAVAWRPDSRRLAAGGEDLAIRLWDISQPQAPPVRLTGHTEAVWALAWSVDGGKLASGGDDNTIRLWDLHDLDAPPEMLSGHTASVRGLTFSLDGIWLASGSHDQTIRLWKLDQPRAEPTVLHANGDLVRSVAFSPDNRTLASTGDDHSVQLWDVSRPGEKPAALIGHASATSAAAFSPDGCTLASTGDDHSVRLWDLRPLPVAPIVLKQHDAVRSAVFSPDGRTLAAGGYGTHRRSYAVQLWDIGNSKAPPATLICEDSAVYSVAWSADSRMLGVATNDGTLRLWDRRAPEVDPTTLRNGGGVVLAFSPNGSLLASAGYQTVRLHDMRQLTAEPVILSHHEDWVGTLAFSPDGRTLASGGHDTTICLWDMSQIGSAPVVLRGHEGQIESLAFSADGRTLASGGRDKSVRLWDTGQPGAAAQILSGHEAKVRAVAFGPDGRILASAGDDKTMRLWNMERLGDPPVLLRVDLPVTTDGISSLAFSPDGQTLAAGCDDGTIRLWIARTETLAAMVCEYVWRNLSHEEWKRFIGEGIPYESTCPNLPATPGTSSDIQPEPAQAQLANAPTQQSPADGTMFHHYPRTATLRWAAVPGAQTYTVQVEFNGSRDVQSSSWRIWELTPHLTTTAYTFDFIGAQPGRWRIWVVDAAGRASLKSDWWTFTFTR